MNVVKVSVVGLLVSIVVAGIFYFVTNTIGFSLIFLFPLAQGFVVGIVLLVMMAHQRLPAALVWGLVVLLSLVVFLVPHYLAFEEVNAYVRENVDSEGYITFDGYLSLLAEQGAEVGKVGRSSFDLGNIGYWALQLLDLVLILGGMMYALSPKKSAVHSSAKGE